MTMPPQLTATVDRVTGPRRREVFAAQVGLLYSNANVGTAVTMIAAAVLSRLEWSADSHGVILAWFLSMVAVSIARYVLWLQYRKADISRWGAPNWRTAFVVGAGLAGTGWGAAGVLLYPEGSLAFQVVLMFVLGGMMLGAGSLLAARPEAYYVFLLPTGLAPAARLAIQGGEGHLAMSLLAVVFTVATLIITRRIYLTIESSLELQFENHDLVDYLKRARDETQALNEELEARVRERTAELQRSTEQLKAEIAEREKIEAEMLRARKLESLGVLAGGIAHDFNNFLTVIQGNIEVAKSRLFLDDDVHAILDQSTMACQRAVVLSSQLLTFAKGGAPVRQVASVARVLSDSITLAKAGARTSFTVKIADDLKNGEIDPGQIGQVLHNILMNARQSMREEGIIEIEAENFAALDSHWKDGGIRIKIRDYGCGVSAENLPRIFDPYFTTKRKGRGLGLATAYSIVTKHGGWIGVESKEGSGTTFTIELPAAHGTVEEEVSPKVDSASRGIGCGRILVMDDEDALRKLMVSVLTSQGYEVHSARDGAEAIAVYEAAKSSRRGFDAVLLDLTVYGGMGGVDAAARLKEFDPQAKLIVASGYSDDPVLSDFRRYHFDAVIVKPWTATALGSVVRKVLTASDRKSRQ